MCGFVGIVGQHNCSADIILALQALQHRGQDSAGVGTICDSDFPVVRKLGLVGQSFDPQDVASTPGSVGIGHVRYPTIGSGLLRDTQPFWYRQPGVLMAHNGNMINIPQLEQTLNDESVHLMSRCDIEPVLCIFSLELLKLRRKDHTVEDAIAALKATFKQTRGAFSLVIAMILDGKETLLAVRDPLGIRPAVWGKKDDSFIVASESVALDALDAELMGNIAPGQAVVFQANREPQDFLLQCDGSAPCVFEYIYFARPDSMIDEKSVYSVRLDLGCELAKAWRNKGIEADVVIPIPDTSRPSAGACAEALGLPYREGFIKNRYTGRTFIMPSTTDRSHAFKLKLNPIRSEFANRRVLIIDDSIVRGSTLNSTIQMIRDQGPKEVHLAIHSPPVLFPCYYGIDMSTREELVAAKFYPTDKTAPLPDAHLPEIEKELAAQLGLDSLTYLPTTGLFNAFTKKCCAACFTGQYPLAISDEDKKWIEHDRKSCKVIHS
jgi:amidophosphoribosyltransferase